ncbi:MAG: 30S ribosomal protein S4 [bacterium]|nr:30S ribosomal protein S4 [bacterium]
MAKELDAKCRMCRRAGVKLFLKGDRCYTPKCAVVRRNYPPGAQGAKKGKSRMTTYGIQLREKQKAKIFYGLSEKQFRNYFEKASRKVGDTGEIFLNALEMRLDNVVTRLGWTVSRKHARQLVSHGHIRIDGKKVNIPSYQLKVGQVLTISSKSLEDPFFQQMLPLLEKAQVPGWLLSEKNNFEGKVLEAPKSEDVGALFDMKLIIEFYSR